MPDTALVVIDIQNDYFPGGAMELEGADPAASKAAAALGATFFLPGTRGAEIHTSVAPRGGPGACRVPRGAQRLLCQGAQHP